MSPTLQDTSNGTVEAVSLLVTYTIVLITTSVVAGISKWVSPSYLYIVNFVILSFSVNVPVILEMYNANDVVNSIVFPCRRMVTVFCWVVLNATTAFYIQNIAPLDSFGFFLGAAEFVKCVVYALVFLLHAIFMKFETQYVDAETILAF
ncbi:hypothetical protein EIN_319690 [Entamoeba invadens IP1]|uniref:Transmembrane protein n=1 Tax=Entamoeba invadens IP1 TaxID=370355 RepID=A0A0A1TZK5_ENTIV|nr:hypothetical protein EIN_319690 [Entamoeba invadens IP1]ELP87030.1 hypothetical protein EIN_319690 [Entamoeba invadens IP1]|eukprot:XP_004253801.1 hypothetical protein EIN_319690 [Entamoeba invadens IP1]